MSEHKQREAELRQQVADQTDVMARLDALEKLEELRDELDRYGVRSTAARADGGEVRVLFCVVFVYCCHCSFVWADFLFRCISMG